ncbi:MAG: PEGA domain-containing protein [Acidobacteriota bacterium]
MKRAACMMLLAAFWPAGAAAQQETDLGEATRQASQALAQARAAYDEADFSQAILLLNRLLAEQESTAPGTLAVEEVEVQVEALKLRGISFFNVGQPDAAAKDFARLLSVRPDFTLDARLVSPKIVAAFDEVRRKTTGLLTVVSEPPGADVRIGDRVLGATPVEDVRLPVGQYRLRVSRPGFGTDETSVEIEAGDTRRYEAKLTRNARHVSIMTLPAEARVTVDGEEAGVTSGTPPPGFESVLVARGLDPAAASAPLILPYLTAGPHRIRVEKECHTPVEATFTVEIVDDPTPMELEPIVLVESIGSIRVESVPSGAEVVIDGAEHGAAPVEVGGLCAGRHTVRVAQEGIGRWWGEVDLAAAEHRTVQARLAPTLAGLGAVRTYGDDDPAVDRLDETLRRIVEQQTAYNPVPVRVSDDDRNAVRWDLYRLFEGRPDRPPVLDEPLRRAIQRELGADLVLVAVPGQNEEADLYLYGSVQGRPDRIRLAAGADEAVNDLVKRLSAPTRLTVGWTGLLTVETADSDFPLVVGAAGQAPSGTTVRAGDLIEAVEGRPVVSRRALENAFATRRPGLPVAVTVDRAGEHVDAAIVTASTPVLPRPGDATILVNKYLADLRLLGALATDEQSRTLARLGTGMAYLMAKDPRRARTLGFEHVRVDRPAGVNQGTVDYLIGLTYEAEGTASEARAREAFARAARNAAATLWRDDGPLVAPFAAARLPDGERP